MIDSDTQKKRIVLGGLMKLMFGVLFLAMVWIGFSFVGSGEPSAKLTKNIIVPLAGYSEGVVKIIEWKGRPVLILKRTADMLDVLQSEDSVNLQDATSSGSRQPAWAESVFRSRMPEWFVAIASGTDFGCPVEFVPSSDEEFFGQTWLGGFKDTCRGSRYDLSGRVFAEQNAENNLEIPSYRIEKDMLYLGAQ